MRTPEDYLQSGKYTEIGPHVRELAESLPDERFIDSAVYYIGCKLRKEEGKHEFRAFTADELIRKHRRNSCSEAALVFIALARAKGIPARYIETVRTDLLSMPGRQDVLEGHIFVELYIDGNWVAYDPVVGKVDVRNDEYRIPFGDKEWYTRIAHGLDFSKLESEYRPGEVFKLLTVDDIWELVDTVKSYKNKARS